MKLNKYIYMLMAGATLTACSSEELATNNAQGSAAESSGDSITITTEFESSLVTLPVETADDPNSGTETRSSIDANYNVQFEAGDKMYVSDGTLTRIYTLSETGEHATFKVTGDNVFSGDITEKSFFSFYPADAVRSVNGKTVTATVYGEQDYTENTDGTFGGYVASINNTNSVGHASFTYRLIGSVIDINLKDLGVTPASVSIMSNSGVSLAGDFKFDASAGTTLDVQNINGTEYCATSQCNVVTVNNINKSVDYVRFYVLPVVVTGGLTITVKDTDGNYYTKTTSKDIGTKATDGLINQNNITGGTIASPYYKVVNFGQASTATRTGNWMACIPGNIKFNALSLPGSHNSATSGLSGTIITGVSAENVSRTQDLTLAEQLTAGVRAFDLRPYANSTSLSKENLYIWHGGNDYTTVNTNILFVDALKTIQTFLQNNPSETVLVTFHQEKDGASDAQFSSWQSAVDECIEEVKGNVATITSNMNLSAARGKMVLIARDDVSDHTSDMLLGKVGWGSSYRPKSVFWGKSDVSTSAWTLYYQDFYVYTTGTTDNDGETVNVGVDNKLARIEELYTGYIAKNLANMNYIYVNMCNLAISYGNSNSDIYNTASRINSEFVNSSVFTSTSGRWGVMLFDYICTTTSKQGSKTTYGQSAFEKVRDHNFDYVYKNRTRKTSKSGEDTGATISGDEYADGTQVYAPRRR